MLGKWELPGQCKIELMRSYHHEHHLTGIASMQEIGLGHMGIPVVFSSSYFTFPRGSSVELPVIFAWLAFHVAQQLMFT